MTTEHKTVKPMFSEAEEQVLYACGLKIDQSEQSVKIKAALGFRHLLFWIYLVPWCFGLFWMLLPVIFWEEISVGPALICFLPGFYVLVATTYVLIRSRMDFLIIHSTGFIRSFGGERMELGFRDGARIVNRNSYSEMVEDQRGFRKILGDFQNSLSKGPISIFISDGPRGLVMKHKESVFPLIQLPNLNRDPKLNKRCLSLIKKACEHHLADGVEERGKRVKPI
jgi:hypothetical protein